MTLDKTTEEELIENENKKLKHLLLIESDITDALSKIDDYLETTPAKDPAILKARELSYESVKIIRCLADKQKCYLHNEFRIK